MNRQNVKKRNLAPSILPIGLSIVMFLLGIANIRLLYGPIIMPDETGYWAAGAYFAGWDWQGVMRLSPYYGVGYGLFLAPVIAIFREPLAIYHAAIVENVILWIFSYWVLLYLAKRFFPKASAAYCCLACFAAIIFPAYLYNTQTTYVESCVVFVFLINCALLANISEKPSCIKMMLLGILTILLFLLHQRTIGVAIALVMTLGLLLLRRKIKPRHIIAFFVILLTALLVAVLIKNNVVANVYQNSSHSEYNDFSTQTQKVAEIFSLNGFFKLLVNCIGRVMYLGGASLLLVYWGMYYTGRDIIYGMGLKKSYSQGQSSAIMQCAEIKVFLFLCVLASIGISAISMIEGNRLDHVIYGRYSEYVLAPILMIALMYLPRAQRKELKIIVFSLVQLGLAVATYIYMAGLNYASFSPYAIASVYGFPSLPKLDEKIQFTIWISILAILLSAAIILLIANRQKSEVVKNAGIVVAVIVWIFIGVSTCNKSIYTQSKTEQDWYEFSKEVSEIVGNQNVYYIVDESEYFTNVYWHLFRVKYFLPKTNLLGVSMEEFEGEDDPQYLLLHTTSTAIDNIGPEYVLILQQSPFCLYAKSSSAYVKEAYVNNVTSVPLSEMTISDFSKAEPFVSSGNVFSRSNSVEIHSVTVDATDIHQPSYAIYGPYMNLPAGQYQASFELELLNSDSCAEELGVCDVTTNGSVILGERHLLKSEFDEENGIKTIKVDFASGMGVLSRVEFRLYVQPGVQFRVTDISYQCTGLERQVMLPNTDDYQGLSGVLGYDTNVLPVRVAVNDALLPYVSCNKLQEAIGGSHDIYLIGTNELTTVEYPSVLVIPVDEVDLLFDLMPRYTVLVRLNEYTVLVPKGYDIERNFVEAGGRTLSDGDRLNVRYFQGSGKSNYGSINATIPAGEYDLSYRVDVLGTPLWGDLGTLSIRGGGINVSESLSPDMFTYGVYEGSRALTMEDSGQLSMQLTTRSGITVTRMEAYLSRRG